MNTFQKLTIAGACVLVAVLFFGFSTKPDALIEKEKLRALNSTSTDVSIIQRDVLKELSSDQRASIQILEARIAEARDTTSRVESLKELSGTWYRYGQYALAGSAAEEVAEAMGDARSWSIAATTYARGISDESVEKKSAFCKEKAIECLENAISLDPDNIEHELNRGILFANYPEQQNPMKGIQILLKLNKNYPENVPVMNNLAKFALQTNQLDRAQVRLQKAAELDPNNRMTNCLSMELYTKLGELSTAEQFRAKCESKI